MDQEKFRIFLQNEFLRRRKKNQAYSLRAYAKHLEVDAGSLSQFLNGLRKYSSKKIKHLALRSGLQIDQIEKIMSVSNLENKFKLLDFDRMEFMREWYYLAIIELIHTKDFQKDTAWIAKRLGLPKPVVNIAIKKLKDANILKESPNGHWESTWDFITTQKDENVDEPMLREHQRQLLELAGRSILENKSEDKSHSAYVAAVDPEILPLIKEEIRKFRRKIANLIESKSQVKSEVFCLQINLFPETKLDKS